MNPSEWLALAGLLRLVMRSDGAISRREHRYVSDLAKRLGPELWTSLAEAEVRLPSAARVRHQASRVTRPEARATIRAVLHEVAMADGMAPEEQALLDWLDALWSGA